MYGVRGRVAYCLQDNDPLSQCRQSDLVMPCLRAASMQWNRKYLSILAGESHGGWLESRC